MLYEVITINKIIADTGVKIDLEDDGRVFILSADEAAADKARAAIDAIVKDVEVGNVYLGKVVRIMNFGAFVITSYSIHYTKLYDNQRDEKPQRFVKRGHISFKQQLHHCHE